MTDTTSLETKGAGGETARAFEEFIEAFEAFKETNDQRLSEIEQRGASDVLVAEKLARIEEIARTPEARRGQSGSEVGAATSRRRCVARVATRA